MRTVIKLTSEEMKLWEVFKRIQGTDVDVELEQTAFVKPEEKEPETEPDEDKNEEKKKVAKTGRPKKAIDTGKIRALYVAGWKVADIAEECHVSGSTVYRIVEGGNHPEVSEGGTTL